jgi:putative toxin-antitoxin system antitoxin component (TIGR02293 family)
VFVKIALLLESVNLSPTLLENRLAYIQAVRQGIPGKIVQQIIQTSGERELFIKLLSTSNANLNRFYKAELLTKVQSEGVLDTLKVFSQAIDVFGDEEIAKEWLHTRIPALNGEYPIELCDTFAGRSLVKECLQAIEYGEFS